MEGNRIEELLERLVEQHDEIIQMLGSVVGELKQVNEELNWVGEHSFAKQVVDGLEAIDGSLQTSR